MAKKKLNFEKSMQQLEKILEQLSAEDISLDDAIGHYAEAARLLREAKAALDEADIRISEIDALLDEAEEDEDAL